MNPGRDRAAALALAAAGCWALWASTAYPFGTLAKPGPGLVPILLAASLVAGALVLAVHGGGPTRLREIDLSDLSITLMIIVLLSAATFALERVGYRFTTAALLFVFLAVVERRPWWASALLAAGFALASFYVVNDLLRVPLPMSRW